MDIFLWMCELDRQLLLLVNGMHTPLLDTAMWLISDKWIWVPLYLLLTAAIVSRYGVRQGAILIALIAVIITLSDQTCASLLRPAICRLRPSSPENPLSQMLHFVNGYRGGRYGFPSCHAANTFALAVFISMLFRRRDVTTGMLLWSLAVAFSRIYLGVHYPGDIIGGFIIGGTVAWICYQPIKRKIRNGGRHYFILT